MLIAEELNFDGSNASYRGMFKNNEAFHFMACYAHVCLDFQDQT